MHGAMPFLIAGAIALAGLILHLLGRRQRRTTQPARPGDDGDAGLATWLTTSTAGDSCDAGGDCGGD